MDMLISKLDALYKTEGMTAIDEYDGKEYFDNDHEEVCVVANLCDELLISNGGIPNHDNMDRLRDAGYRVTAGEKEGFGWLTGIVKKIGDERRLVFG